LFGAIHINDQPVMTETIPQSTRWKGLSSSSYKILLKESTQRLDRWLIQGRKEAAECRTMG
jgi:hypothetical protein